MPQHGDTSRLSLGHSLWTPYSKPRRKVSEGSAQDEAGKRPKIPRPMNCFMIFRKEFVSKRAQVTSRITKGKSLASQAGEAWRSLSASEQEPYKRRADELSAEHARLYPNYKLVFSRRPRKPRGTPGGARTPASGRPSSPARQQEPVVRRETTLPANSLRQEVAPISLCARELGPSHPPVLQYPRNPPLPASNFVESLGRLSKTWPNHLNQCPPAEHPNPAGVSLLPLPSFHDKPLPPYPLGTAHEPSLGSLETQYPRDVYLELALAQTPIASPPLEFMSGAIFHTTSTADMPLRMTSSSQGAAEPLGALRNTQQIGHYHFETAGSPAPDLFFSEAGPSTPSKILSGKNLEHIRPGRHSPLQMDDFDPFSPHLLYSQGIQFPYSQDYFEEANVANGDPIRGDLKEQQDATPGLNTAYPLQEYVIDEFLHIPWMEENAVVSGPSH